MSTEALLLLAILIGAGAAAATGPGETTESTAETSSIFPFEFPEFPAFPDLTSFLPAAPTSQVEEGMPYWYNEVRRLYPNADIRVGPLP